MHGRGGGTGISSVPEQILLVDKNIMLLRLWALSVPRATAFSFALTLPLARRLSSFSAFGMAETAVGVLCLRWMYAPEL